MIRQWATAAFFLGGLLAWHTAEAGTRDGTGTAAAFNRPTGIASDSGGNLYVADFWSHTIRKITPAGEVTTFAGEAGEPGSADGKGAAARFNFPAGVAVDRSGNVYVADAGNDTIRKITPDGAVTTLAGAAGRRGHDDGAGAAARFQWPFGVAVDQAGNVYVADTYNSVIRKITPDGVVTTLAGTAGVAACGSSGKTGAAARFQSPMGIAADAAGNVYVSDPGAALVYRISPGGAVRALAGAEGTRGHADGTGTAARFSGPGGIAVDRAGNVYVADGSTLRKISPAGAVSTIAGVADAPASGPYSDISYMHFIVSGCGYPEAVAVRPGQPVRTAPALDPAAFNATAVAVDASGALYVAGMKSGLIRWVRPHGQVEVVAGHADADSYGWRRGTLIYAADSSVSLRELPSTKAAVVNTLPIGTALRFVQTQKGPPEYGGKDFNCRERGQDGTPPPADGTDWICVYAGYLDGGNERPGSVFWAASESFAPRPPRLDGLLAQYDTTPRADRDARRKWAERAFALEPASRAAQQRLTEILTELGDRPALDAAQQTIARWGQHQPTVPKGENPLIFIYDGASIEPFAEMQDGVPHGWGEYRPAMDAAQSSTQNAARSFYARGQFYYAYADGRADGILATPLQINCERFACPRKVPVLNLDSLGKTPPDGDALDTGRAVEGYDSNGHWPSGDVVGIATNFPLPARKQSVQKITAGQKVQLERMVRAQLMSIGSEQARTLLLEKIANSDAWAGAGRLADGRLILVAHAETLFKGDPQDGNMNQFASLIVIAEQQPDGTFKVARSPPPAELMDYRCADSGMMDVDGDGTDDIILTCRMGYSYNYGLIRRTGDHWERAF